MARTQFPTGIVGLRTAAGRSNARRWELYRAGTEAPTHGPESQQDYLGDFVIWDGLFTWQPVTGEITDCLTIERAMELVRETFSKIFP